MRVLSQYFRTLCSHARKIARSHKSLHSPFFSVPSTCNKLLCKVWEGQGPPKCCCASRWLELRKQTCVSCWRARWPEKQEERSALFAEFTEMPSGRRYDEPHRCTNQVLHSVELRISFSVKRERKKKESAATCREILFKRLYEET